MKNVKNVFLAAWTLLTLGMVTGCGSKERPADEFANDTLMNNSEIDTAAVTDTAMINMLDEARDPSLQGDPARDPKAAVQSRQEASRPKSQ